MIARELAEELFELTKFFVIGNNDRFEYEIIGNNLKIITPFTFKNNDYIEVYLYEKDGSMYLTDDGFLFDNVFIFDKIIFEEIIKNFEIYFNKNNFLIKEINKYKNAKMILKEIIDFANDLQRIESFYYILENNNNLVYKLIDTLI